MNHPLPQVEPTPRQRALCCECGNLRTCKQPPNLVAERCDSQTWHRMTGDLKCDICGHITRHALLRPEEQYRDYAERYQRMALGGQPTDHLEDVERARREYRQGIPRNPALRHRYWVDDAQAAWDAGQRTTTALCGDTMGLNRNPRRTDDEPAASQDEPVCPGETDWDTEYEDPETGLWWVDMDCVNCLRVANGIRRDRRRRTLAHYLSWFACHPEDIPEDAESGLLEVLSPLAERVRR